MSNVAVMNQKSSLPALNMTEAELMNVLRNSLYVGAKDESIKLAVNYCKAAGLDIMQKPVHLVPMYDSKTQEMRDVVMPGIGLYRTQASRSEQMAGISEPEFGEDVTFTFPEEEYYDKYKKQNMKRPPVTVTYPKWCKVTVKKLMANGMVAEYHAKEIWTENYATASKDSDMPNAMWKKRPYGQLAKCAEAQALRKAFPELGSMPTAEEMEGKEIDVTPQGSHEPTATSASKATQNLTDSEFLANEPAWKKKWLRGSANGLTIEHFKNWVIDQTGKNLTGEMVNKVLQWKPEQQPEPTTIEGQASTVTPDQDFLAGMAQQEATGQQ